MKKFLLFSAMTLAAAQWAGAADFITNTPEGEIKSYIRSSNGYIAMYSVEGHHDTGSKVDIVYAEDGTVYMNYPMIRLNTQGWLAGYIDGDEMVFNFPQPIYEQDGEIYDAYVFDWTSDKEVPAEFPSEIDGDEYTQSPVQEYRFTIDGETIRSATPGCGKIIGLLADYGIFQIWAGFGDCDYELKLFTGEIATPPAGLETKTYAMIHNDEGGFVNIGVDNSTVWAQGLSQFSPEGWAKGTLGADGTVTFASGQCVGALVEPNTIPHYAMIYGATGTPEKPVVAETLAFDFDQEAGQLTARDSILINRGYADNLNVCQFLADQKLNYQADAYSVVYPADPKNVKFQGDVLMFNLPQLNREGGLIASDMLYYRIWRDDEIFTLYPDEYEYLGLEELTDVPNRFTEFFDVMYDGTFHEVMMYSRDWSKIGVQAVCKNDKGVEKVSDIVYNDGSVTVAAESIAVDGTLFDTTLTDLQGRRVSDASAPGVYIQTGRRADGTRVARKVLRR